MSVVVLEKKIHRILEEIKKNTPVIVYRNFFSKNNCKKIVSICHNNYSLDYNRKKNASKYFNFTSLDVLNSNVKSKRIFRTFELSKYFINKFDEINNLLNFQKKILRLKKNKKIFHKVQVIHYPKGGGFFEKHRHSRYPTNYGFIITLSEKNKDFKKGGTNFVYKKKNISLEKFDVNRGDLILFRYDLPHSISKCDPNEDLKFDMKGRWTMILPVYHEKF